MVIVTILYTNGEYQKFEDVLLFEVRTFTIEQETSEYYYIVTNGYVYIIKKSSVKTFWYKMKGV